MEAKGIVIHSCNSPPSTKVSTQLNVLFTTYRSVYSLQSKYNEQIKCLSQTDARLTIEDLEKDDSSKNLLCTIVRYQMFCII